MKLRAHSTPTPFDCMEMRERQKCIDVRQIEWHRDLWLWLNDAVVPIDLNVCAIRVAVGVIGHSNTLICCIFHFQFVFLFSLLAMVPIHNLSNRRSHDVIFIHFVVCPHKFVSPRHAQFCIHNFNFASSRLCTQHTHAHLIAKMTFAAADNSFEKFVVYFLFLKTIKHTHERIPLAGYLSPCGV